MLKPKRRHLDGCGRKTGETGTECPPAQKIKCPYIVEIYKPKRRQISLDTSDWDTAMRMVNQMVLTGHMEPPQLQQTGKTVTEAVETFLRQKKEAKNAESTLKTYRKFLCGSPKRLPNPKYSPTLLEFAAANSITHLSEFGFEQVTSFRNSWKNRRRSMTVQSMRLKEFFGHAHDMGWIKTNPTAKLKPPKVESLPVTAFSVEEISRIKDALAGKSVQGGKTLDPNSYLLTFSMVMRPYNSDLVNQSRNLEKAQETFHMENRESSSCDCFQSRSNIEIWIVDHTVKLFS